MNTVQKKNPHGEKSLRGKIPAGKYLRGDFSPLGKSKC